jgi:energy-coupling factor transport system substrate-specific component
LEADEATAEDSTQSHWGPLKEALQGYRESVGSPSYGSIAERITQARVDRGMDVYAARVGRTTVYDAFNAGQRRVNLDLIREIGAVLGASPQLVEGWIKSCHKTVEEVPEEEVTTTEPLSPPTWKQAGLLIVFCLGVNQFGIWLTDFMPIQLFLDMAGTAIAAIALGPWRGALVGYLTAVLTYALGHGYESLFFGIVQVAGALAWGYGVRFGAGKTLLRYVGLNLGVACLSTTIAAPLIVYLFGGTTRHGTDALYESIRESGHTLVTSVVSGNLTTSIMDKLLAGGVALVVVAMLPLVFRTRFPLAVAVNDVTHEVAERA